MAWLGSGLRGVPVVLLMGLGWVGGCAGTQTGAEAPKVASGDKPATSGDSAATRPLLGMSDALSSGTGVDRPKMNALAAESYQAGMRSFRNGDLEGATRDFQKAIDADPNSYQALYSLGVVRERLGDTSGATAAYGKAISVVSDYEPAIVAYALLIAREGNAPAAEEYLNQRAAKMNRTAALLTALAEVRSMQGDSGGAQRLAKEALKQNPDYRPAMIALARDHYRARRLDLSLYALQGILDGYGPENPPRDKDNPEALLLRGLILKERGQRSGAVKDFQRCLELRPDLVEAMVHLAGYLLEAGNATEATPLLESALRYDRDNILARLNLGDAYRLLGRPADAKVQLEWVAQKEPRLAQVHYSLGLLYLFSAEIPGISPKEATERATGYLEQYRSLRPRSGPGQADDAEELITAAKSKKAMLEAQQAEAAEAAAAASAAAAAPPAPNGPAPAAPSSSGSFPTDDEAAAPPTPGPGSAAQPASKPKSVGSFPEDDANPKEGGR